MVKVRLVAVTFGLVLAACSSGDDDDDGGSSLCNNGTLDSGEKCDPGIAAGMPGACPTTCGRPDACTSARLVGAADACTAECVTAVIDTCGSIDGCCPTGCTSDDDVDCTEAVCGNGTIEGGETCDGDCPTTCDRGNACETATLMGSAAMCNVSCGYEDITACTPGDGCCASGCTPMNDSDCRGQVGDACMDNDDCDFLCATADGFGNPGGSCTVACGGNPNACPTGSHCGVEVLGIAFCNKDCTDDSDCRMAEGYRCVDQDGDNVTECAPTGIGAGAVGDPCMTTADCAGGDLAVCLKELTNGASGGYCAISLCGMANPCPMGSHCAFEDEVPTCVKDCTPMGNDCRATGYACYNGDSDAGGTNECWIAGTGNAAIGDACQATSDCGGGAFNFCFNVWPDGYCTADCSPETNYMCPMGASCVDFGGDFARCLDTCNDNGDCRNGYTCTNVDNDGTMECVAQ